MVRMDKRNNQANKVNENQSISDEKLLQELYRTPACEIRTRYDLTIKNLEQVFDEKNIYYGFFENLFEKTSLEKLYQFLEIPELKWNVNYKSNVSPKNKLALEKEVEQEVFKFYKDTYIFCSKKFDLGGMWPLASCLSKGEK